LQIQTFFITFLLVVFAAGFGVFYFKINNSLRIVSIAAIVGFLLAILVTSSTFGLPAPLHHRIHRTSEGGRMLYALILTVHLIACFMLIAVILLQAGRGGGLTDMGGGSAQSILGTRGATILTRATTACAVIFMLTSLSLAVLSARRGRSLMENVKTQPAQQP
jgi:preprotein translocase subunit SecG